MLGAYISVSRYHLMSRIYLSPERNRRNENSSATAAFQARRLIPFLAWQKTKGHLKGYVEEEGMAGSYEKEDDLRIVRPVEKWGDRTRQDEEEAEDVSRICSCANCRDLYRLKLAILEAECLTDCWIPFHRPTFSASYFILSLSLFVLASASSPPSWETTNIIVCSRSKFQPSW